MSNGGSYDPHAIESDIYHFWEESGFFHAEPTADRPPYVIDIPLPNVTGALHLGHALNNTLQDVLIRYHRMRGCEALWMPGTDHAGIATQAVVERKLKEEQGLTRHELGREGLVAKIWEWKEDYGGRILNQLRKLGASADWARARFTLDEVCARAVYEVFFQWFKARLIYRGLRLVNWDAYLQTAVADDEIVHETVQGHFWHLRYPILDRHETTKPRSHEGGGGGAPAAGGGSVATWAVPEEMAREAIARATAEGAQMGTDFLIVATTRPETMLGDTAVCVHPRDERYQRLIGKHALLPLQNRAIPIIADPLLAKMELGSGCVKVTPAHDPNDYACGQRNGLEMINILTPDGKINDVGGSYAGLDRYDARQRVAEDLQGLGLLDKVEEYEHEVGHSDRSKTPIEPLLSEQWFVKMADLAELAMEAARDGRVRFYPERYEKTFLDWLGEKRDWCISRQLWWGHRIPVWTKQMSRRAFFDWVNRDASASGLIGGGGSRICVEVVTPRGELFRIAGVPDEYKQTAAMRDSTNEDEELLWRVCLRDPALDWGVRAKADDADWAPPRVDGLLAADWLQENGFEQDPDVLDTWFSSALWPFSTLGWPDDYGKKKSHEATKPHSHEGNSIPHSVVPAIPPTDLDYFYPTTVLVTSRDIITLWVARMVMTGLYFQKRVPFSHVHIHPVIQDGQGRRMSKSVGNGVDPLDIIELYGTDALRFTMAQMDSETQDARLPVDYICPHCQAEFAQKPQHLNKPRVKCEKCKQEFATRVADAATIAQLGLGLTTSPRFELGRNFCNKIWQAATGFVIPNLVVDGDQGGQHRPPASGQHRPPAGGEYGPLARGEHRPPAGPHESTEPRSHEGDSVPQSPDALIPLATHANAGPPPGALPRPLAVSELPVEDRWILSRLARAVGHIDRRFSRYQLNDVAGTLYDFFWSDFCDWYVELVKPRLFGRDERGNMVIHTDASAQAGRQVLAFVLDQALRLLHPVLPFITEALWKKLGEAAPHRGLTEIRGAEPALIKAAWPDAAALPRDARVEREITALQSVIKALRDALARINASRSATRQPAIGKLPQAVIRAEASLAGGLAAQRTVLERLGRCEAVEIGSDVTKPPESATQVLVGVEVYVPLAGLMDLAAEKKRLGKERDELVGHFERLKGKLANENFVAKAPPAVVEQERARLVELQERLAVLERNLADLV